MSSSAIIDLIWKMSWQAVIVAALVWLICRLAKRAPARFRHALWLVVLIKFLVPPIVPFPSSLAVWERVPVREPLAVSFDPAAPRMLDIRPASSSPYGITFPPGVQMTRPSIPPLLAINSAGGRAWTTSDILATGWAFGVFAMALLLLVRRRRLSLIVSGSQPAGEDLRDLLQSAASDMSVRRLPALALTQAITTPMLAGMLRPVILLPADTIETCSQGDLRAMLLHELAHIKRRDMVVLWVQQIAQVLFYFHPTVWTTARALGTEREIACDEMVLSVSAIDREDYASGYVSALKSANRKRVHTSLAMAEPFDMELRRLNRILHGPIPRLTLRWAAMLLVIAVAGVPTFARFSDPMLYIPSKPYSSESPVHLGDGGFYGHASHYAKPVTVKGKGWEFEMQAGVIQYPEHPGQEWLETREALNIKSGWWGVGQIHLATEPPDDNGSLSRGQWNRGISSTPGIVRGAVPKGRKTVDVSFTMVRCGPPVHGKIAIPVQDIGKAVPAKPTQAAVSVAGWSIDRRWLCYLQPDDPSTARIKGENGRTYPPGAQFLNVIILTAATGDAPLGSASDYAAYGEDGRRVRLESPSATWPNTNYAGKYVVSPYYGFSTRPVRSSEARRAGISQGYMITDVDEFGPAYKAGVRTGDILTGFRGVAVGGRQGDIRDQDILWAIGKPGVTLTTTENGKTIREWPPKGSKVLLERDAQLVIVRGRNELTLKVEFVPDPPSLSMTDEEVDRIWQSLLDARPAARTHRDGSLAWECAHSVDPVPPDFKLARVEMTTEGGGPVIEKIPVKLKLPIPPAYWR